MICKITVIPVRSLKRGTLAVSRSRSLPGSLVSLLDYNASFLVRFQPAKKRDRNKEGKSQYFDVCTQMEMELSHSDKEAAQWRQLQGLFKLKDTV